MILDSMSVCSLVVEVKSEPAVHFLLQVSKGKKALIDLETLGFGLASTRTRPHSTQVSILAYLLPFPLFPCPVVTHNESIFL